MRAFWVLWPLLTLSTLAAAPAVLSITDPILQAQAKSSAGSLLLHVSFLVIDGEKRTSVPLNHKFPVGDRLRIEVTPSRTGFLYLFSRARDGKRERLWPPGQAMLGVSGGQTIAVPEHGSFRMEGDPGDDTIELFFTESPLADPFAAAGPQTGSRFRQIRLREIKLDNQPIADPGSSFETDLDDRGVAILELKVTHR
jgi:hypothetical protein